MLQKVRNTDISFYQSRYAVDKFHNPYLSKFTLKLTPSTHSKQKKPFAKFTSPFDPSNYLYISQSLPIFKSQKFRTSLIWKQSIKNKMGRGFIGLATQYKADNLWSLRTRVMCGTVLLYNLEAIKKIDHDTEAIIYQHGMYDNVVVAPILGVGIKKKDISATLHRRFGLDYNAIVQYTRPLPKGLYLCFKTQTSVDQNFQARSLHQTNTFGLDYYLQNTIRSRAAIINEVGQRYAHTKFEIQKTTQSHGHFLLSIQYKNQTSILSFGYKNPTLNFVLPFLMFDSPIPTLIGAIAYVAGYFLRKKNVEIVEIKKKQEEVRINEIKLISDKANANYDKQRASGDRGLLIEEAFVGPARFMDQLEAIQNRGVAILRDNQMKENVFDITICMRFYVIKGQLKLKKGDKTHLLGFYCNNMEDDILIRYSKNGQINQVRVKMTDQINIK